MNTRWAVELVDSLAAEGLRHAVVCPGSRSTPLALALDHHPDVSVSVHIDERGAGYFALGIGRASGRPAAVLTTSGTAVANLLPAVAEAHQDNVPLVALTADRPPSMRDSGANQTMDQPGLFSRFVRYEADLPMPAANAIEAIHAAAQEAMRAATRWPPGPVHLNQPFQKPLEPDAAEQQMLRELQKRSPRADVQPLVAVPAGPVPDAADPRGPQGLVVCGPGTGSHRAPAILGLAARLQAPVLADALSGLRHVDGVGGAYDLFLGAASDTLRPRFVIQFGRSPTSSVLRRYLAQQPCPRWRFDHSGRRWDDIGGDVRFVVCDPLRWIARLMANEGSTAEAGWLHTWQSLDEHARRVAGDALRQAPDVEAAWVPAVVRHARRLFVGNSMPVRDLDRFSAVGPRHPDDAAGAAGAARAAEAAGPVVAANRGVSGIDGTIATAAGWAAAAPSAGGGRSRRGGDGTVAVVGDVAFQHDVGSLPLIPPGMRLVVIDNGGGRIFHHLPIHASDRFERLFLTPPTVDIPAACAAYGIDAMVVAPSRLPEALDGEARVIVVRVDGAASATWRQELERRVHEDVPKLLATAQRV